MFYKHWKKIALTLTALFWAACEDSTSAEECLYGPPSYYGLPESSDANGDESSSSEATGSETSSSSSEATKSGSSSSMDKLSSSEVTCVPLDSSFMYFAQDYSADNAKFWKEEAAKHDAVAKIDSVKETLAETPMCLEHLRMELDQFVALYGAPTIIRNAVDSCSDGTIKPSEEYAKFLKMQEEWEANKSALEEELKKVYEDKMKEIEARIKKCLNDDL